MDIFLLTTVMTYTTQYTIHSRITSRFLLRKINDMWCMPFYELYVVYTPPVSFSGLPYTFDDFGKLYSYLLEKDIKNEDLVLSVRPNFRYNVDHILVHDEFDEEDSQWFNLTTFPENCDPQVFKVFNDKRFLTTVLMAL